ncbi:hypothetical protein [Flavobacterium sp. FlaQc-28]|uniref:hypothetical protein n=1 Tax=Flavobacterium sp. FlaQc-28 TaxID=3374178 RepID=UPI0037582F7A
MNNLDVKVTGFEELKTKIKLLSNDKDKKKEIILILRQVARPSLLAAKNAVPVSSKSHTARGKKIQPGNLRKSLGLILSKADNPTILVGPRAKNNNDGWYGHMVHDGHAIYRNSENARKILKNGRKKSVLARVTKKRKGSAVGRVEGVPYLDIAYAETKSSTTADAQTKLTKFIQRRIDKLSR